MPRASFLLFLTVIAVLALLWLLWPTPRAHSRAGGGLAPDSLSAPRDMQRAGTSLPTLSRRVEVEPPEPELDARPSIRVASGSTEEEPETGSIHGSILDSTGARLDQGRVLVFADRKLTSLVTTLKLEGPELEYRCELPANQGYYLLVEPQSLGSGYVPALARSRKSAIPTAPTHSELEYLGYFTKYFVALEGGEEVRRDLEVGLPARATGRLLERDGRPISGALARLSGIDESIAGLSEDCITDEHGVFAFAEVYPGNHRLTFSMASEWSPPTAHDVAIAGGEDRDLGDFRAGGGQSTIRGRVVDQDGEPFPGLPILCYSDQPVEEGLPAHDMGSVLGRATTDESGLFELAGLAAIPVKVTLTPDYDPGSIQGPGHPAYWEYPVLVDLQHGPTVVDVGTQTVDESRPFEVRARVVFDVTWLAESSHGKRDLSCTLSQVEGESLAEGVRRASIRARRVALDPETDTFTCLVETPMTTLELRLCLRGSEDLLFTLQPEALETWSQEVRVPSDFVR